MDIEKLSEMAETGVSWSRRLCVTLFLLGAGLAGTAHAANTVNGVQLDGDSKMDDLQGVSDMVTTLAEFAEDYAAPTMALLAFAAACWSLFQGRFQDAGVRVVAAVGLAGLALFLTDFTAAFGS